MSGDTKIRKLGGYQPSKGEVTKGSEQFEVGMDGYQPRSNEATKGYRPTQPVDMSNLRIPKNLGTAAVMPRNGGNQVRASVEPKKE
jgi:hypothetical protein